MDWFRNVCLLQIAALFLFAVSDYAIVMSEEAANERNTTDYPEIFEVPFHNSTRSSQILHSQNRNVSSADVWSSNYSLPPEQNPSSSSKYLTRSANLDSTIQPKRNAASTSSSGGRGKVNPAAVSVEDADEIIHQRRDTVRQMMKHAWDGYVKYAWGYHELRPISRHGHSSSLFGDFSNTGVTIVDSLDTLFIMGLMNEFQQARDWIEHNLNFKKLTWGEVSVFEINIRFVGGLLSCFALTGDHMFREKAFLIAERLLPAFDTPTGIPLGIVNMENGVSRNPSWASEGSSILSELGTLSLEFNYLSDVTGNGIFRQKIQKLTGTLKKLDRQADGGLYPNFINPWTGDWGDRHVSIGAFGDSFYEYLLKSWLLSGRQDDEARLMYIDAVEAALSKLIQVSKEGFTYFAESNSGRLEHKMQHLACFSGGMLGLGGFYLGDPFKRRHMAMGKAITRTCHESYHRSISKLGPETFRFNEQLEAEGLEPEAAYLLRPEVVESYFIMWRLTHDPIYRQWGWEVVQALEKNCRVEGAGYSGLKDVNEEKPIKDDVQQSFFLAETLKYLYLLFSDDDVIPLDQWVFNTEAHPLPVSLLIKENISTPNQKFMFRD